MRLRRGPVRRSPARPTSSSTEPRVSGASRRAPPRKTVRFTDFLRTTALISAAAASPLGATTARRSCGLDGDDLVVPVSAGWWVFGGSDGSCGWGATTRRRRRSLAARERPDAGVSARGGSRPHGSTGSGPCWSPRSPRRDRIGAAAGSGGRRRFAIIWTLAWRRQAPAVTAIEERDGARFYVERTSPLQPIKLVRTPGFRSNLFELTGSGPARGGRGEASLRACAPCRRRHRRAGGLSRCHSLGWRAAARRAGRGL